MMSQHGPGAGPPPRLRLGGALAASRGGSRGAPGWRFLGPAGGLFRLLHGEAGEPARRAARALPGAPQDFDRRRRGHRPAGRGDGRPAGLGDRCRAFRRYAGADPEPLQSDGRGLDLGGGGRGSGRFRAHEPRPLFRGRHRPLPGQGRGSREGARLRFHAGCAARPGIQPPTRGAVRRATAAGALGLRPREPAPLEGPPPRRGDDPLSRRLPVAGLRNGRRRRPRPARRSLARSRGPGLAGGASSARTGRDVSLRRWRSHLRSGPLATSGVVELRPARTADRAPRALFESAGFRILLQPDLMRARRLEGLEAARMPDPDQADRLFPRVQADPAFELYSHLHVEWDGVYDLTAEELARRAEQGQVRSTAGGRALAVVDSNPGWGFLSVRFLSGSGAALRDLAMALRFEADLEGLDHVRIWVPEGHPAVGDLQEVGYDFRTELFRLYFYALRLSR